jgi:hypothetical protein
MPNLETLTDAAVALPATAYHATRYADWTDSVLCSIGARHAACRLTDAQRRRALASFTLPTVPQWTICDVGDRGAAAYRSPASVPAAYSPFGAMVLACLSTVRRQRYYATEDVPPAAPNLPLDGCHCRVCLERQ